MKDAASTTETRTVTVPTVDDGPTLLYTLDFECPFPWPQAPSYPTSSHAAIVTAAGDSKSGNANGVNHYMQHTHMDDTDAPTASTSKTRAEAISVQEGDRMLEESSSIHDAKDAGDALAGVQEIHYPDTLQEYYWDCLYCSTRRLKVCSIHVRRSPLV